MAGFSVRPRTSIQKFIASKPRGPNSSWFGPKRPAWAGDEFAAVLTDLNDVESAIAPAEKIIAALKQPMTVLDQTVQIGASIGIAYFPDNADSEDALVTLADNALYEAKGAGRNTFRVHKKAD